MKYLLLIAGLMVFNTALAEKDRGGGDPCEAKIQNIGTNLADWMMQDGHKQLDLNDVAYTEYKNSMLSAIDNTRIECVWNKEVIVEDTEKLCAFTKSKAGDKIQCNGQEFLETNEFEQYRLIHHEYAGIAGFENPDGAESEYWISDQLSHNISSKMVNYISVLAKHNNNAYPAMTIDELQKYGDELIPTCDSKEITRFVKHLFYQSMDGRLKSNTKRKLADMGTHYRSSWITTCNLFGAKSNTLLVID